MKVLMFSGGLDSTILFYDLLSNDEKFMCCFVDYNQKNADMEYAVVSKLCLDNGVKLYTLRNADLFHSSHSTLLKGRQGEHTIATDEIPNRNALLANYAAANLLGSNADEHYELLFGAHKTGSCYADATPLFYKRLSMLLSWSTNTHVKASAPYIRLTKKQVVTMAWRVLAIPKQALDESVSCYEGNNCGKCPACIARRKALEDSPYEK